MSKVKNSTSCTALVAAVPKPAFSTCLFKVLDDHDQEGKLDAQCLSGVRWCCDEHIGYIITADLQHTALDILIGDALDVTVPDLQSVKVSRIRVV